MTSLIVLIFVNVLLTVNTTPAKHVNSTASNDTAYYLPEIFLNKSTNTSNDVKPGKVHLKALKQANAFLEHIQEKIRISRQLLESVDYNRILSPKNLTTGNFTANETVLPSLNSQRTTEFLGMFGGAVYKTTHKAASLSLVARKRVTARNDYVPPPRPDYHDILFSRNLRDAEEEAVLEETAAEATPPHTASPGDVLLGIVKQHELVTTTDPHPVLHHEMENVGAGYLSVGFQTLCNLIATKEAEHVRDVMGHTEGIIVRKTSNNNQLNWLGQPMLSILERVIQLASAMGMDEIRTFSGMLVDMMKHRRQYLSSEVNYILDYADDLMETQEGDHLFDVLTEFKNYPNNTTKTGLELCEAIFSAFETPYLTLINTEEGKKLVLAANNAFKKRYPSLNVQFRSIANKNESRRRNSRRNNQRQNTKFNKNRTYNLKNSTDKSIIQPGYNYEQLLRRYNVQTGMPTRKLKPIEHTKTTHRKDQTEDTKYIYNSDISKTMEIYDDEINKNIRNKGYINGRNTFSVISTVNNKKLHFVTSKVITERNLINSFSNNQLTITGHTVVTTKNDYPQKRFNVVSSALNNGYATKHRINLLNEQTNRKYTDIYKNFNRRSTRPFPRAYINQNPIATDKRTILNGNINKKSLTFNHSIGGIQKLNSPKTSDFSSISDEEMLKINLMDHLVHYNITYQRQPLNESILDASLESNDEIVLKSHLYKALNN